MKVSKYAFKAIALSAISLLIVCSAFFYFNSLSLSKKLDQELLEKESLLSEKIHLNRSLEEVRKELSSVTEKNLELKKILETKQDQIKNH